MLTTENTFIRRPRQSWKSDYAANLFWTDSSVVFLAIGLSEIWWFGLYPHEVEWQLDLALSRAAFSVAVAVLWAISLTLFGSRREDVVGSGALEYKRVIDASFITFGFFAVILYLVDIKLAQGYFFTALPVGLLMLLMSRWGWRQWLRHQQGAGFFVSPAVLVGSREKSAHVASTILSVKGSGIDIVGAFTAGGSKERNLVGNIPVLGDFLDILTGLDSLAIETLILTDSDALSPRDIRELGWSLAERNIELIVAPALTDIAGPRIHARPLAGLPLILVDYPSLGGFQNAIKRLFDVTASSCLVVMALPILIGVAIAVKTTSPGRVFYKQERIGARGKPFDMLKFRSMTTNADEQLASLLDAQGSSRIPLFKISNDTRITPVGRYIRKFSLDELPQLLNVIKGQMSLVGPRPQRAPEVALYEWSAHRRLLVKPGMSGLWQVSGRSNLSWDDSIRLDLYYVENWSLAVDFIILLRTFRAVVAPKGAV